jgi:hypothetical protein
MYLASLPYIRVPHNKHRISFCPTTHTRTRTHVLPVSSRDKPFCKCVLMSVSYVTGVAFVQRIYIYTHTISEYHVYLYVKSKLWQAHYATPVLGFGSERSV